MEIVSDISAWPEHLVVPPHSQVLAVKAHNEMGPNGGVLFLDSDYIWTGNNDFGWKCIIMADENIPVNEWAAVDYDDSGWNGVIRNRTDVQLESERATPIWLEGAGEYQSIFCRGYIRPCYEPGTSLPKIPDTLYTAMLTILLNV